jgi:hypothetical protein
MAGLTASAVSAITMRLASCIYAADCDCRSVTPVLWDMVPLSKQMWYFRQAAKVLKNATARKEQEQASTFVRRAPRPGETRGGQRTRP